MVSGAFTTQKLFAETSPITKKSFLHPPLRSAGCALRDVADVVLEVLEERVLREALVELRVLVEPGLHGPADLPPEQERGPGVAG